MCVVLELVDSLDDFGSNPRPILCWRHQESAVNHVVRVQSGFDRVVGFHLP